MLQSQLESQRKLADRLRQAKASGRIVMNIKPTDTDLKALPDLTLEDGDELIIPYRPPTVSVLGAVYDQADFIYRSGGTVSSYLKAAGGVTRTGDKKRLYILRANGSVLGSESAGGGLWSAGIMDAHLYPGDAIVVPEQIDKVSFTKGLINWSQILAQLGFAAAAIHVLAP
jgi:polysaccharide export outer membrane protein